MDKTALLYYGSALDLKLPMVTLERQIAGFEVRLGKIRYFFRGGDTPFNQGSSIDISSNKFCTNRLLQTHGLPVPKAEAINKDQFKNEKLTSLIANLRFPLVVKPMKGTATGDGVLCNINNLTLLRKYLKKEFKRHHFLSIEEFHGNLNAYRVLVFYNKVIGVVERFPARVVGDGVHSIQELIFLTNQQRETFKETVSLGSIKIDEEVHIRLEELQLSLESVPKKNETVVLCYTCNSTRGGTMESLGKKICKENARLLCRAADALGLNLVGFDVVCENILIPIETSRGVIIEANHNPDITIHEHPMSGIQTRVSKKILQRLILRHPFSYFWERNRSHVK